MIHRITPADVRAARASFEANEPRDLFYRAATELVDLAIRGETSLSVAEALAVLLQTWNRPYYQYRRFDNAHFASIEGLLGRYEKALAHYRNRSIDSLEESEQAAIVALFEAYESVLGPVGAAKALHLLARGVFPLWDRAIAYKYGLALGRAGSNGERYWQFMSIAKRQCVELGREDSECGNTLKSIDEYNYCKFTKGWI